MRPLLAFLVLFSSFHKTSSAQHALAGRGRFSRVVLLKVDGLSGDLLYRNMEEIDPHSGKSKLPWLEHVFADQGIVFENFYTRGISLSAPSWSILDTGQHAIIRGNAEFDRYTGKVYDYLNVFPFYIGYARKTAVDMPGVEVLDRAGIPLLIDRFRPDTVLQSFQLFQRGVTWTTLQNALLRSFSRKALVSAVESAGGISLSSSLYQQLESEVIDGLHGSTLSYLDFYTGDADHEGHATSDPAALLHVMEQFDSFVGRVWTAIEKSPLANETLLVVVSDHGMNNVPGIVSQTYSLPDFFNSREAGGHHVVTDREQLSDFKLRGINPLVHRVITPSADSLYLKGQASQYPTAWLDIDGNERTAVQLRNNDLNKIHILLLQLRRSDLAPLLRAAAVKYVALLINAHRETWAKTANDLAEELVALRSAIDERKQVLAGMSKKFSSDEQSGKNDKAYRRLRREMDEWQDEDQAYTSYLLHLQKLLAFSPAESRHSIAKISELIAPMTLGDNNTFRDIQHYAIGLSERGVILDAGGELDPQKSFSYVDYFALLSKQRARNNPQPDLSSNPIDFLAMRLPDIEEGTPGGPQYVYLLYRDSDHQLLVFQDQRQRLMLKPVRMKLPSEWGAGSTAGKSAGGVSWHEARWTDGLPLSLWEDPHLQIPTGADRKAWLSDWHNERDWLTTIHKCQYSNGVISITEELRPVGPEISGPTGTSSVLLRYERRRRELVQTDFHVFAADHWNFNARFPNAGGNHGSFLRISTQSVWMMAGTGLHPRRVEEPYDSLNFSSTVLALLGQEPPMPDRIVQLP